MGSFRDFLESARKLSFGFQKQLPASTEHEEIMGWQVWYVDHTKNRPEVIVAKFFNWINKSNQGRGLQDEIAERNWRNAEPEHAGEKSNPKVYK